VLLHVLPIFYWRKEGLFSYTCSSAGRKENPHWRKSFSCPLLCAWRLLCSCREENRGRRRACLHCLCKPLPAASCLCGLLSCTENTESRVCAEGEEALPVLLAEPLCQLPQALLPIYPLPGERGRKEERGRALKQALWRCRKEEGGNLLPVSGGMSACLVSCNTQEKDVTSICEGCHLRKERKKRCEGTVLRAILEVSSLYDQPAISSQKEKSRNSCMTP